MLVRGRRPQPKTLRTYLLLLVLVTLLPMLLFGGALIGWLVMEQRERVAADVEETAKALTLTIDRELDANIDALEALAGLNDLTTGDIPAFYERSQLARQQHPYWNNIALIDANGQQIANTARPFGADLPSVANFDFVQRLIGTRQPVVSDLIEGPVVGKPIIVVLVPVLREGALKYILSAVVNPKTWSELLAGFESRRDLIITLSDGNDRIVARARDADAFLGRKLPEWFIEARGETTQGILRGPNLENREVVGAYYPTRLARWSIFAGVTISSTIAPLDRTALVALGSAVVFLALSAGLATAVARRLAVPVRELAVAGQKLAEREPIIHAGAMRVRELDELRRILARASTDLVDAAKEAERAKDEALHSAEEAIRARDLAEKAERAKTQFFASASHDLRQPVQSLFFFAHALAERVKGHPEAELLSSMELSLDALKLLLDSLLDVSRLDAGAVKPQPAEFALSSLIERLAAEYGPRAESQGIGFRVVTTSAWVRTDPMLLERMVRNLIENALRYTAHGGILIGCRRGQNRVHIAVVDTGIGISEHQQELIFEEFVQIGNPERDRTKGLGLGLAIVKRLAALLDHRVTVRSEPGRGSTFSIELPRVQTRALQHRSAVIPANDGGRQLVVVIDDEALILLGLRAMLEDWKYDVVAAMSGEDAVRLLDDAGRVPDMIIADYRLREGRTGIEAIRDIHKACNSDVPAIVLTGDTAPERIAEVRGSGFRLIHKPITPTMLRDVLASVA
jgi:signal transduction histidine kinase